MSRTSVRLAELFPAEFILFGLVGRSRREVVEEMIGRLSAVGRIPVAHQLPLAKLVLDREKIGSTALGRGVAFPRCRTDDIESHLGVLAIDNSGVDFAVLDGQKVHLIFLIVAPQDGGERHLQIMGSVRALAHDEYVCRKLRVCRKPEQVTRILREFDATLA
ncbi:MAG: PTS sugar transporter subunit IIA [Pirellulaceae bacterium]|nr:PTS sugar transporter subunit IIA [Pirellulaceae bacterium]